METDEVYQQAVQKLRILLAASEVASSMEEEEYPTSLSGAAGDGQGGAGLTDPPVKRRYNKNPRAAATASARRTLNFGGSGGRERERERERERHNSWHNLTHIGPGDRGKEEELSLLAKQEQYIKQLEKETVFCRQQLAFVLQNVKSVLTEKESFQRSDEVSRAISNVFGTIQGWQNNVSPAPDVVEATDTINKLREENARLAKELQEERVALESPHVLKLKKDNAVLTEALRKVTEEMECVRVREEEAVEQVKSSVQAAEQLKMEKTELEYESSQLKLQMDRQQVRIRVLFEEQMAKVDEERSAAERRGQEQLKLVKEEQAKMLEESVRLSTQVEQLQRTETELRRQVEDRDHLMGDVKRETEKRLGQLQTEVARLGAAKQEMAHQCGILEAEGEQMRKELQLETTKAAAEAKSLRTRLARTEEALLRSRQEALDLAEEKATLQCELGMSSNTSLRDANVRPVPTKELVGSLVGDGDVRDLSHEVAKTKMENMIRRQSRIIGELKHQCTLVTDKLEEMGRLLEEERRLSAARMAALDNTARRASQRVAEAESRLQDRAGIHQSLCHRLQDADLAQAKLSGELRQARLLCEEVKQEKALALQEAEFLRGLLKSRGMLPEREETGPAAASAKKKPSGSGKKDRLPPPAIVVQRNGKVISPPLR